MTGGLEVTGRAADAARAALRTAFGDRLRSAGPDRTEALAQDGTALVQHERVRLLGDTVRGVPVTVPQAAFFEGFLDGIQRSSTIAYLDGVPLVHGTAAAAIRERDRAGRMTTWTAPTVHHAVYASRATLGERLWDELGDLLESRDQYLQDTDNDLPVPSRHPAALVRQALDALAQQRDALERDVGDRWCETHPDRPLYVDGSLRTSSVMKRSSGAVGVVKSHATLYVADEHLPLVMTLPAGFRTTVLEAVDRNDRPVFHTWYLRLRDSAGRDPFFGLIRAEVGARDDGPEAAEARADAVSTWLLAERAPIARPDARWDVMPYAIRDCEVYLRVVA